MKIFKPVAHDRFIIYMIGIHERNYPAYPHIIELVQDVMLVMINSFSHAWFSQFLWLKKEIYNRSKMHIEWSMFQEKGNWESSFIPRSSMVWQKNNEKSCSNKISMSIKVLTNFGTCSLYTLGLWVLWLATTFIIVRICLSCI